MNTALATPTRPPLRADEYVVFTAGRTEITLQCIRVDLAYTITTYVGSQRIDDCCTSIDNEIDARVLARGYAHLALQEAGR
jgi:hypothetical protein